MKWRLQLRIMLLALRKSGSRSLFVVGTVGLGIAAMMITLALGAGAEQELQAITERMGRNLLVIRAAQLSPPPGRGTGWSTATTLDLDDVAALGGQISAIDAVAPILEGSISTRGRGTEHVTSTRGVTPEFVRLRNFQLAEGRLLDEADDRRRARVAVIGPFVSRRLDGGWSLVGQTIWIAGVPFEVVGELREKGITDGQNEDDQILIPLSTARRRLWKVDSLSRLLVQVSDAGQMQAVEGAARELLRIGHGLGNGVEDDFEILTLIRANQIRALSSGFLRGLSQLFAAMTLAMGGVGVLAVTFLNVKERTAEIGLRMAVGARRRQIAGLFVAEACLLSGVGGGAGLLSGWMAVEVARRTLGWRMVIDLRGVAIALLASVVLGLLFGVLPALRAARVMPIEALRDI